MTDSGQEPESAPEPTEAAPNEPDPQAVDKTMRLPLNKPPVDPTSAAHASADPNAVDATMRLPVQHPHPTSPPPSGVDATMRLPAQPHPHPAPPPTPPPSGVDATMRLPAQPHPPPAPPTPAPPSSVDATMRLPVQHPSTPPEPAAFAVEQTMRLPAQKPPDTPPSTAPPPSAAGPRHIGKYIIKGELGRGGMGAVYLAEQPGLGREVAIKELIQSAAVDPTALKRFMQEAQVMARTSHPNLVQVHDLEQIGDANYIVLEFVRGKSLRDRINERPIPMPQAFAVMHGVLQALDYAHKRQIVHRDMKPENVLLSDEGEVKVADFGIARLTDDSGAGGTATKTGTTVGTPQYMSPEQVASSKVDGRSDLYSAGIMFYELITGQPPFTASDADGPFTLMAKHVQAPPKPPSVLKPGLDLQLEEVILKSLSKRPEDRYQTGHEFDDAMSRAGDRLCPGWQRSLEPGADLSLMVPPQPLGAVPGMPVMPGATPPGQAAGPVQIQAIYNPTPPVRPVAKKSAGCLGVMVLMLVLVPLLAMAVAANIH
jgi:protein kinase-like protein